MAKNPFSATRTKANGDPARIPGIRKGRRMAAWRARLLETGQKEFARNRNQMITNEYKNTIGRPKLSISGYHGPQYSGNYKKMYPTSQLAQVPYAFGGPNAKGKAAIGYYIRHSNKELLKKTKRLKKQFGAMNRKQMTEEDQRKPQFAVSSHGRTIVNPTLNAADRTLANYEAHAFAAVAKEHPTAFHG